MELDDDSRDLKDLFREFGEDWLVLKKEAMAKRDFGFYRWWLVEVQKTFTQLYVETESKELLELIELVLKVASCENLGNMIKYNRQIDNRQEEVKQKMLEQKLSDLSDTELLLLWAKGKNWLNQHEQSYDKAYNHELYLRCLRRFEAIEDELQRRRIKYG